MDSTSTDEAEEQTTAPAETPADFIPEANMHAANAENDEQHEQLLAQLQAKINAHNENAEDQRDAIANGIWEFLKKLTDGFQATDPADAALVADATTFVEEEVALTELNIAALLKFVVDNTSRYLL